MTDCRKVSVSLASRSSNLASTGTINYKLHQDDDCDIASIYICTSLFSVCMNLRSTFFRYSILRFCLRSNESNFLSELYQDRIVTHGMMPCAKLTLFHLSRPMRYSTMSAINKDDSFSALPSLELLMPIHDPHSLEALY